MWNWLFFIVFYMRKVCYMYRENNRVSTKIEWVKVFWSGLKGSVRLLYFQINIIISFSYVILFI